MVALIVLNYNDADTVIKYINKIKKFKFIEHIVIVDNHSTDDSYARLILLKSEKICVIQTTQNKGYATGNNFGAFYAIDTWNPDCLVISNPDVEFDENIIEKLKSIFDQKADAAGVTCRMNCTSEIKLPIAWKLPTYKDCLMENLILLKHLSRYSKEYSLNEISDDIVEVETIPGSFFMVDAKKFKMVGGFDENTFLYNEENILGRRFKNNGYKQYLLPKYGYVHHHSVSINQTYRSVKHRLRLCYSSREYYCVAYLNISYIQKILLRMTFEIGTFNYLAIKTLLKMLRS